MRVRVKKIGEVNSPDVPSGLWESYICGADNGNDISLPIEYELEGEEIKPPSTLQPYMVMRDKRNDVECTGIFRSTSVQTIVPRANGYILETRNSKYIVEFIK